MRIPKAIQNVIESFERLPGIGPKSAQRLTFYLLHVPQHELDGFADAVRNLKIHTKICSVCFLVDDTDPCSICSDQQRDNTVICVVEAPLDVMALERSGKYKGVYHVLHGKIDPLNNIGPEEIYIGQLLERVRAAFAKGSGPLRPPRLGEAGPPRLGEAGPSSRFDKSKTRRVSEASEPKEIILATNPTMEGEATAMYISKQLRANGFGLRVTRIGRGLPIGADIEYADSGTLQNAIEGRSEY